MLASHIPSLLPETMFDLQIDRIVHACAVVGVGLLHAKRCNTQLTSVFVRFVCTNIDSSCCSEIIRPAHAADGGGNGHQHMACGERAAFALACGMTIGWICLGGGVQMMRAPLSCGDCVLTQQLIHLLNGGPRSRVLELNVVHQMDEAETDTVGDGRLLE